MVSVSVGVTVCVLVGMSVGIVIMPFYIYSELINLAENLAFLLPPGLTWAGYRCVGHPETKYHDTGV